MIHNYTYEFSILSASVFLMLFMLQIVMDGNGISFIVDDCGVKDMMTGITSNFMKRLEIKKKEAPPANTKAINQNILNTFQNVAYLYFIINN